MALRTDQGKLALLRDRTGEYTQDVMAENARIDGIHYALEDQPGAQCSADLYLATRTTGGRTWHILATRSVYPVKIEALAAAFASVDIVSDRRLPWRCHPHWLKLDASALTKPAASRSSSTPLRHHDPPSR